MASTVQDKADTPYLERLAHVECRPVFVIGPHRSGTTILYKTLLETGCFNVTTAYHVLNHSRLLHLHFTSGEPEARQELVARFERNGLKDRSFDSMPISPEIPEEYCFALEPQGRRPGINPRSLKSFADFCRKAQVVQDPQKPLLLKNPFDTTNFLYIHQQFPEARFVFIYRHPADVINSQMKAIRSLLEKKNEYVAMVVRRYRKLFDSPLKLWLGRLLYSDSFPILYGQVSRNIAHNCDYVLQNVDRLGPSAIGLTYPDFCRRPNENVARILDFIGATPQVKKDYSTFIQVRESAPLPIVAKHRASIEKRNEQYCRKFGL